MNVIVVALKRAAAAARRRSERADIARRLATLTEREREVMRLAAAGLNDADTAARLELHEVTARVHRRRAMDKMRARSRAQFSHMVQGLRPAILVSDLR